MKKIIILLSFLTIVSCKQENNIKKTYTLEVTYRDSTIDTIVVEGYRKPQIRIYQGISIIDNGEIGIEPVASYVKSFKIIK